MLPPYIRSFIDDSFYSHVSQHVFRFINPNVADSFSIDSPLGSKVDKCW